MKITNNYGLPDTIVRAVQNDRYSRGGADYSATDLIAPPRIVHLKRRYHDQIEEDVSDRVWSLLGRAVHSILESAQAPNAIQEERIFADVLGRTLSGASDLYSGDGTISDYKVTSVYTSLYGSRLPEWTAQLNIYAWLYRSIGFEVQRLEVVALYRDWRASEAQRNPGYPQRMVESIPIELWPEEQQLEYIETRLQALIDAEEVCDADLPECTPDDMWSSDPVYAVHKSGARKAARLLPTEGDAQKWIAAQDKPSMYEIQYRPGQRRRCEQYCPVAKWCSQYKAWQEESGE